MKITPTMRRAGIYGLVAMAALGTVATSTSAHASTATPDQTTKTVAWVVTSGDLTDRFGSPQTLFGGEVGACGQPLLQVDLYRYDTPEHIATVDALTSKGTLGSAAEDGSVWISNVDLQPTAACTPTPEPTPTPTTTPPVTPPPTSTPSPSTEPTAPPVTPTTPPVEPTSEPKPSDSPSPSAPQPSVSVTPPAPSGTPAAVAVSDDGNASTLAFTGSRDMTPFAIAAAGLLAAGGVLVARAFVLRRRERMGR